MMSTMSLLQASNLNAIHCQDTEVLSLPQVAMLSEIICFTLTLQMLSFKSGLISLLDKAELLKCLIASGNVMNSEDIKMSKFLILA